MLKDQEILDSTKEIIKETIEEYLIQDIEEGEVDVSQVLVQLFYFN